MDRRDWLTQLRAATHRRDGAAVVTLAEDPARPSGVLQLLGDGLAAVFDQRVDGLRPVLADCVAALRERGWAGDVELADQLDALSGTAPTPMLRSLAVDLDQLSELLEGDPMTTGGGIDLRTGEVWPRSVIEYAEEGADDLDAPDFEDEERFRWVDGGGSRDGYRDMESFIDTIGDHDRADRLGIAIQGRGAFRRFRDVLARWPDELDRWYAFRDERQRGRAREWLADAGYRVASD
ncbi:hypothetical protein GCM10023321_42020 [Pseudonocardia eucalypti]|uniref:Uncharacterized protein n=1 Tax=Pseudonocardia eucalypti TaxID=648755 RepID=A0ABP9QDD1_9PSEU|nr:hypothetical protein [Pseudonocardia eucalypti]